jgi:hypothetical protein
MAGLERVECGECGYEFPDPVAATKVPRSLCALCGATTKKMHFLAEASVGVSASMRGVGYTTSKSNWLAKFYSRPEWHRALGRLHDVSRMFNKRTDEYHEVIHDHETGELVMEVHEPLSEHQGHGSAKNKVPDEDGRAGA